jgi:hypothetical protein
MKAEDIRSFDVTPSWERPAPAEPPPSPRDDTFCQCGLCKLVTAGHL